MLTENPAQLSEVYQRGLMASTLISQPFWKELEAYMAEQIQAALENMEKAKHADQHAKANLLDRWILTKELVEKIEKFPLAAIEAAREFAGEQKTWTNSTEL